MASYKDGTISVISNSDIVEGIATKFLTNVTIGEYFIIFGALSVYRIISVIDDTHIKLDKIVTGKAGNIISGLSYRISSDFTPILGLPIPTSHDVDSSSVINRALTIIDRELPTN
jgi:hypothetical protein